MCKKSWRLHVKMWRPWEYRGGKDYKPGSGYMARSVTRDVGITEEVVGSTGKEEIPRIWAHMDLSTQ